MTRDEATMRLREALTDIIAINSESAGEFRKRGYTRRGLSIITARDALVHLAALAASPVGTREGDAFPSANLDKPCVCGHTLNYHGNNGVGRCNATTDCGCECFCAAPVGGEAGTRNVLAQAVGHLAHMAWCRVCGEDAWDDEGGATCEAGAAAGKWLREQRAALAASPSPAPANTRVLDEVRVNINSHVRVRLTEAGRALCQRLGREPAEQWQLWDLMAVFGPSHYMGAPTVPFVANEIVIQRESAAPVGGVAGTLATADATLPAEPTTRLDA